MTQNGFDLYELSIHIVPMLLEAARSLKTEGITGLGPILCYGSSLPRSLGMQLIYSQTACM